MDYEKAKAAYQQMTPEQQKSFVEQNRSNPEFQNFVTQYWTEVSQKLERDKKTTPGYDKNYAQLKDPNQSLEYYWDDSSADQYAWNLWGKAPKYEWEWVRTSDLDYNKDITTKDLDAYGYKYWWASQEYGSQNPWYISRRNDNIASALYNEWRVSREDVQDFLESQEWFWDSTPEERANTIESVWKRLGIRWENEQQTTEEQTNWDIFRWEQTDEESKLYGKVGADTTKLLQGTDTYWDDLSIGKAMQAARKANYDALNSMSINEIAISMYAWTTPYWEQAMRDLQIWNPVKYQAIQEAIKNLYGEDSVNAIAKGEVSIWNKYLESIDKQIETDKTNWVDSNSNERTKEEVKWVLDIALESNQVAQNAKQEMLNINKDIAEIQAQIDDLPLQARKLFKGDASQEIVNAFVNNETQRLQKEISKLESRYNAAAEIYKTELANTQWEKEYELKRDQFNEEKNQFRMNYELNKNKAEKDNIHWASDWKGWVKAYMYKDWKVYEVDDWTAYSWYQNQVQTNVQNAMEMAKNNADYWECEDFTDDLTEAAAWVRMVWVNWSAATTSEEKQMFATQFDTFSDYIPQVWDVAVFKWTPTNKVSIARWHTMYVTWYDENTWMVTLVWSNGWPVWSKLHHKVYQKTMSLQDFYKETTWWVWFWNPYKYAQWEAQIDSWYNSNNLYSPMQPTIDKLMQEYRDTWKTNMFSELWKFQEIYTNLYNADKNWELSSLLDQWLVWTFLQNMALTWAQSQGGDSNIDDRWALERFFSLNVEQILAEADNYYAQHKWDEKAYAWFQEMMRAVEIKLRDESWAAINRSERATNFLLYLPKATDTQYTKERKLARLEEYIRRLGTDAWIDSSSYIPLNLGKAKPRSIK